MKAFMQKIISFVKANDTKFLAGAAIAGVGGTAILSFKAGMKVERIIRELPEDHTKKDVVKATWKTCILPASLAVGTGAAIVGGHLIDEHRKEVFAAAAGVAEANLKTYKENVVKRLTADQVAEIDEATKKDLEEKNVSKTPSLLVCDGGNKVHIVDRLTGTEFDISLRDLDIAKNEFNNELNHEGFMNMCDWYNVLSDHGADISFPDIAGQLGWNAVNSLMSYHLDACVKDYGIVLYLIYDIDPVADYETRYN